MKVSPWPETAGAVETIPFMIAESAKLAWASAASGEPPAEATSERSATDAIAGVTAHDVIATATIPVARRDLRVDEGKASGWTTTRRVA
jgi:hypothetical protein